MFGWCILYPPGVPSVRSCVLLPVATGMSMMMVLLALHQRRPQGKYVLWPRIDQKSCFKCILSAGKGWTTTPGHVVLWMAGCSVLFIASQVLCLFLYHKMANPFYYPTLMITFDPSHDDLVRHPSILLCWPLTLISCLYSDIVTWLNYVSLGSNSSYEHVVMSSFTACPSPLSPRTGGGGGGERAGRRWAAHQPASAGGGAAATGPWQRLVCPHNHLLLRSTCTWQVGVVLSGWVWF